MAAPLLSVTVPVIEAVSCANKATGRQQRMVKMRKQLSLNFIWIYSFFFLLAWAERT
jgi:hypothetical protein